MCIYLYLFVYIMQEFCSCISIVVAERHLANLNFLNGGTRLYVCMYVSLSCLLTIMFYESEHQP